ncbi:MAG: hypothetical protein J5857_07540 [Treponema sp.]|nr:hypothetical protein [Treponema sp.]
MLIAASVVLSCLALSCTTHSEGGSITSLLDMADQAISIGDTKQALGYLNQASKQAGTTLDRLGVFKRYETLGDSNLAEKTLKKAIKKDRSSIELIAVYSNFLLNQGRFKEALKKSKSLSGTKYGSIYAEAVFRRAINEHLSANEIFGGRASKEDKEWKKDSSRFNEIFYDSRFATVYQDAFRGSKRPKWNWNAAVLDMRAGNYGSAAAKYPSTLEDAKDSLFWALVMFDCGRYAESLEALNAHAPDFNDLATSLEFMALKSDNQYILGMDSDSEKTRDEILAQIKGKEDKVKNSKILPILYVNSALYSRTTDDHVTEYDRLHDLVTRFPDYRPGLAAYGEFAIQQMRRPPDDKMTAHIRASGLATIKMEKENSIPDITVQDAIVLIQAAKEKNPSADLIVLQEILEAEAASLTEPAQRAARVWPLLEKNEQGTSLYPAEIVHYAIVTLLESNYVEEARDLFTRYENASRQPADDSKKKKKKAETFVPWDHPEELSLWENEISAWFCVYDGRYDKAIPIYQYIIDSYSDRSPVMNSTGQNEAVVNSYINMGNIYAGTKQGAVAVDYLNKASSRSTDPLVKAEILYRMGKESYYLHDFHSAVRSLQYAIKLNPSHNKARFILQQVQEEENRK